MSDVLNHMPSQDSGQPLRPPEESVSERERCRSPKRGFALLAVLALVALLLPVALVAALVAPGPLKIEETVVVPRGYGASSVARTLSDRQAVYHPLLFRIAARAVAYGLLKAGEYRIEPGMSVADIALMMHDGRSVVRQLTIPEGLTSVNVASLIENAPAMTGTLDVSSMAEGSLLPETYRYTYGDTRADLAARMREAMGGLVKELWLRRDAALPIHTPEEAVVMASIVEKETGKASERARIAGVFYNRLRASMRLQSDPTVIYAIWKAKGSLDTSLSHEDMSFPSPYNTYASDGLPPKPICNPGKASLEAVLHPEQHDYYYFVADGTGGHVFSHALAEHNRNVAIQIKPKRKPPHSVGTSK